jgi:O-methyltransferase
VFSLRRALRSAALRTNFPGQTDLLLAKSLGAVRFGKWLRESDQRGVRVFSSRFELYESVAAHLGNMPIHYLEFGVYRGESFTKWLKLNTCPESTFDGFDSFEGLPEDWKHLGAKGGLTKGHFSTKGLPPDISDVRLRWHKGWFQETLPEFMKSFQPTQQIVINIDCDLYSSTLYVLALLSPVLRNSIMFFDELAHVDHEFRALCDYCSAFGMSYDVLGAAGESFLHTAIKWK